MNEFLQFCGEKEIVGQPQKQWKDETSHRKYHRSDKATKVIVSPLEVIAPGDAGSLWETIQMSHSVEKVLGFHIRLTENT